MVETSPHLIIVHDLQGRMVWANPATCRLLGHRAEELEGRSGIELLAEGVRGTAGAYLTLLARHGEARGVVRVLTAGGEERFLEYHSAVWRGAREALPWLDAWQVGPAVVARCTGACVIGHAHDVTAERHPSRPEEPAPAAVLEGMDGMEGMEGEAGAGEAGETGDLEEEDLAPPAGRPALKRLLLVDDEEPELLELGSYFRLQGYEIDSAREREEAEALLLSRRYALVIVDLRLPPGGGGEGLEVLRAVRQTSPETLSVVLAPQGSGGLETVARGLGARAVLRKPRPPSEIGTLVHDLLARD